MFNCNSSNLNITCRAKISAVKIACFMLCVTCQLFTNPFHKFSGISVLLVCVCNMFYLMPSYYNGVGLPVNDRASGQVTWSWANE